MNWNELFDRPPTSEITSQADVATGTRVLVPLDDHRLIIVSGADTMKFLQGQLTCDIAKLDSGHGLLGAHCTPKGRMISSFLAAKLHAEDTPVVGLRVHASIAEAALAALKKYAVFSKVGLELSDTYFLFALQGNLSEQAMLPELGHFVSDEQSTRILSADDQCEFWCKKDVLKSCVESFPNAQAQSDSRLWRLKNIQRGIAEVEESLREKLLPQEINFQLTEGISFSKGCYTGQEIIARLHYRGQLKKHMRLALVECETPPQSGQAVFSAAKNVGMLINVAQSDVGKFECLVLCDDRPFDDTLAGTDSLQINPESPVNLRWLPLPYAIK